MSTAIATDKYRLLVGEARHAFLIDSSYAIRIAEQAGTLSSRQEAKDQKAQAVDD